MGLAEAGVLWVIEVDVEAGVEEGTVATYVTVDPLVEVEFLPFQTTGH